MTRWEQETARKRLIKRGLIEEKKQGLPCKLFFRIVKERLISAIESLQTAETSQNQQFEEKPQTRMGENHKLDRVKTSNWIEEKLETDKAENPISASITDAEFLPEITPEITSKNTYIKKEVCVVSEKLLDQDLECGQQSIPHHDDEINQDSIPGSRTALLNDAKTLQVVDTTSHEGLGSAPPICKNDEPNQEAIPKLRTTLSSEAESLQVANITSPEGRSFAPPIRKTSQKQEWICPGSEEEKNEFLVFKGGLLVADKKCKLVESRTAALGWANRNPEAANLLWEDWQKEKVQDASQNTAIETVPEFSPMPEQEHVEMLEKFINVGGEEFLKLCWWHKHWLQFATTPGGQKRIPELTPKMIKQIKQALR